MDLGGGLGKRIGGLGGCLLPALVILVCIGTIVLLAIG
jgi:hypothetical protein